MCVGLKSWGLKGKPSTGHGAGYGQKRQGPSCRQSSATRGCLLCCKEPAEQRQRHQQLCHLSGLLYARDGRSYVGKETLSFRTTYCMDHVLLAPGLHLAISVAGRATTATYSLTRFILQTWHLPSWALFNCWRSYQSFKTCFPKEFSSRLYSAC